MSKINFLKYILLPYISLACSVLTQAQIIERFVNASAYLSSNPATSSIVEDKTIISNNTSETVFDSETTTINTAQVTDTNSGIDYSTPNISNAPSIAPTITVTEVTVPPMIGLVGDTFTEIVNASGTNLTGNLTISIIDDVDNQFDEPSVTSIAKLGDNTASGTVTVTYRPTISGTHTATLKIESSDATSVIRALNGTGIDPNNPYSLDNSSPLSSLNETFEGVNVGTTLPTGWKNISVQGAKTWEVKAFNSNKYAQMNALGSTDIQQSMLISPAINLDAIIKNNVTFGWLSGYATPGATLKAYVMTLNGTKTEVKSINASTPTTGYAAVFTTETLDLSVYNGVAFLVFEYNGSSTFTTTYEIDNIVAIDKTTTNIDKSNNNLNIYTNDGNIEFSAITGETVSIFNAVGQKLIQQSTVYGLNMIHVPFGGVFLVKVGNRFAKVIL